MGLQGAHLPHESFYRISSWQLNSLYDQLSLSPPNHDSPEAFENAKHDSKTQSYKAPNVKPKEGNKTSKSAP
jgi:hypothetical protein